MDRRIPTAFLMPSRWDIETTPSCGAAELCAAPSEASHVRGGDDGVVHITPLSDGKHALSHHHLAAGPHTASFDGAPKGHADYALRPSLPAFPPLNDPPTHIVLVDGARARPLTATHSDSLLTIRSRRDLTGLT